MAWSKWFPTTAHFTLDDDSDYGRWWMYVSTRMTRVAQAVYPTEFHLEKDLSVPTWMKALGYALFTVEGLTILLSDAYVVQARHTRLSTPQF